MFEVCSPSSASHPFLIRCLQTKMYRTSPRLLILYHYSFIHDLFSLLMPRF